MSKVKLPILLMACSVSLSACSSFQARPSPVLSMRTVVDIASKYKPDIAVTAFHSPDARLRYGLTDKQYRNMIISIYMAAIDARYHNFVSALSTQNKGSNLALSTVALGLSSAATVTGQTAANILSAGSAFVTGSNSKISQTLYFEKTLPALIAGMETNRNEIKLTILGKLDRDGAQYPIETAFADIAMYQNSASLDSAIERLTSEAGAISKTARDNVSSIADQ